MRSASLAFSYEVGSERWLLFPTLSPLSVVLDLGDARFFLVGDSSFSAASAVASSPFSAAGLRPRLRGVAGDLGDAFLPYIVLIGRVRPSLVVWMRLGSKDTYVALRSVGLAFFVFFVGLFLDGAVVVSSLFFGFGKDVFHLGALGLDIGVLHVGVAVDGSEFRHDLL